MDAININFDSVKYVAGRLSDDESAPLENIAIVAVINSKDVHVPLDPANRHYKEILRQVEEGTLTIADAEPVGEE